MGHEPWWAQRLSRPHSLAWNRRKPVLLKTREGSHLGLKLALRYEIVRVPLDRDSGPYRVQTLAYEYSVQREDGTEMVAFHWHPFGDSPVTTPHFHVGSTVLAPDQVITGKLHVPTSRIAVEQVLRWCITELGVSALRDDWERVLNDGEDVFKLSRSWG